MRRKLPEKARRFVWKFDQGFPVAPFSFMLYIPDGSEGLRGELNANGTFVWDDGATEDK